MSDPQGTENETDQNETDQNDQGDSDREPVQGVDLDPGGADKHIEVDTQERLDHKADAPNFDEISDEELEEERQKRLAPENRPDNVEIDNSQRTFNPETGLFEDSEVDEPPEGAPFATVEGEKPDDSDSEDGHGDESKESEPSAEEPKDRQESTDADQSKEAKESKDTES